MLIERTKRTIKKYGMLSPGDRLVAAVSGGPDSVCLVSMLRALAPEYRLQLHIAHLDHMFRGAGSAADARFVEHLAAQLGIPATIEAADVPAYCRERGRSSQAGAREVRYRFLQRVADEVGATKIALGHTANDQAETLLMRLVRGAGMEALGAIPPVRENIIRPLVDVTRQEILDHLKEAGLTFVTDPSNERPVYTRNRIRLEIIPRLEQLNPRIVETLAAVAALLRDESVAAQESLSRIATGILRPGEDSVSIDRMRFLNLLPAFKRRVLRAAVARLARGNDLSLFRTDEAIGFMEEAQTGRSTELPGDVVLERSYKDFVLRPRVGSRPFDISLAVPGSTAIPELSLSVETQVTEDGGTSKASGNYLWQAEFDYAKIALPLSLRSRRDGDRFCPAGMEGRSKKLQDFLVDEKVPRPERDRVPILVTERDVLWVVGMRLDHRFLPGPGTGKRLIVTVRRSNEEC